MTAKKQPNAAASVEDKQPAATPSANPAAVGAPSEDDVAASTVQGADAAASSEDKQPAATAPANPAAVVAPTEDDVAASTVEGADAAHDDGEIAGIRVRSVPARRCRSGICFDQTGRVFIFDELSEELLASFMADTLLQVEACKIPAQPEADA